MAMASLASALRTSVCSRSVTVAVHGLGKQSLRPVLLGRFSCVRSCAASASLFSRQPFLQQSQAALGGINSEVTHSRTLTNIAGEAKSDLALPVIVRSKATLRRIPDPEKPKRPATAWIRYLAHFRESEGKGLKAPKEVMTAASTKWKKMSAAERRHWEEAYQVEKKEHDKKMKAYVDSGKRDAWKRDPERPKVPMNGFFRFAAELREQRKDSKITEVTKMASANWKAMNAGQRAPYEKKYLEEKKKYDAALKTYVDSGKKAAWEKKVGITAAKEKIEEDKAKKKEKEKKAAAAKKKKDDAAKAKATDAKKKQAAAKKEKAAATSKKAAAPKQETVKAAKQEAPIEKKVVAAPPPSGKGGKSAAKPPPPPR